MKKRRLLVTLLCGLLGTALGLNLSKDYNPALADNVEPTTPAQMTVSDLQYLGGDGCSWNNTDNSVSITSGQSFEYRAPSNVVIDTSFTFNEGISWAAFVYMNVRATETANDVSASNGFSNPGYRLVWRANGEFWYYKGASEESTYVYNSSFAYMYGGTYHVVISTIDMSDGSVQIILNINDTDVFNINDSSDVIVGNIFAARSDGSTFTLTGQNEELPIVQLTGLSSPKPAHAWYGPNSIEDDGTVHLANSYSSGVYYNFYSFSGVAYGYELKIKSIDTAANIYFTIGGSDYWYAPTTDTGLQNQDDKYGFVIGWYGGGNFGAFKLRKSSDLSTYLGTAYSSVAPSSNTEHTFQVTHKDYADGSSKVTLKCDGVIRLAYIDENTSENTPINTNHNKSYVGVYAQYNSADIVPTDSKPTTRSISNKELGNITFNQSGDAKVDRNGNVTGLSGAMRYEKPFNNTFYEFDVNFTSLTGSLPAFELFLNYSGEPDTPWGGGWTQKGYCFRLYSNGMYNVFSKGTSLYEGWPIGPGSFSFTTDTYYSIKVGSWSVGDDSSVIALYVNDNLIFSFVDLVDDVNETGQFAIRTEGAVANLSIADFVPVVMVAPTSAGVQQTISLSYENPEIGDDVSYYIDDSSTAAGIISNNQLTVTKAGTLYVYAKVNGVYSDNVAISCIGAQFDILPEEYTYGSSTPLVVSASFSDQREIKEITYTIEEGSDIASINNDGEVTLTGIGNIRISATLTDISGATTTTGDSEGYVVIKPMETFAVGSVKIGQEVILNASINAPIPSGDQFEYSIIDGEDNIILDGNTITGVKAGSVTIRATFASGKNYSVYADATFDVIGAKMKTLPANPIIVGNGDGLLQACYTDDSEGTDVRYFVDDSTTDVALTGKATVNEETGVIHYIAAGTIKVYATVDGLTTEKTTLVLNPKVEIGKANSMAVGGERELGYIANCDLPDENIVTTYEIISGSELIEDFNPSTGHVKAKDIGVFTVRVTVYGETFSATSVDTQIAIEAPIVVVTEPITDMIVGNEQEIHATLGNEEIHVQNKSIVVTEGSEYVDIDGMTIKAINPGQVSFKVVINGFEGVENVIVVSPLTVTLNAGDMYLNDTQELSYLVNDPSYIVDKVEYSIVSGQDIVSLDGNTLHSNNKSGEAIVKVTINDYLEATATVKVNSALTLTGLVEDKEYLVNTVINLDFINNTGHELTDISYEVVSGNAVAETIGNQGRLTITGEGEIIVVVKSGDVSSLPVRIIGKTVPPAPVYPTNINIDPETAKNGVDVTNNFNYAKDSQQNLNITVDSFVFSFNQDAVNSVAGKDVTFKFNKNVDPASVGGAVLVFDVSLEGSTFENGKVNVSFDFTNEAKDTQDLKVFYIDEQGNKVDMNSSFENGKLSFETNHFSRFAVMYVDKEPKNRLSTGALIGIIAGSVVAVATIGVGTALFLKKSKNKK